ncbi:retinol dehydrogenase 14-like [Chironomus tepperi]|uniref:retinol dehydrogenase 14-like n=1 Tax=Chironomus tepperi TaxID=113505 RepID=UPI00391F8504
MSCSICTYIYSFTGIAVFLYLLKRWIRRGEYNKPTLIDNKIVVITGANTGIGKETAIDLARRGGKIYIACRDRSRGENALVDIRRESGSDKVYFLQLDLASLKSIRDFSKKFHQLESKLDILINNAGIMACPKLSTEDGFEMQIGVNHLGHFLLTNLLLDLLKSAAPSRIVNVSSKAHVRGEIYRDDFMLDRSYAPVKSYAQSKLANILFTRKLANVLAGTKVTANSCHPGIVTTELARHIPKILQILMNTVFKTFLKTPVEGAQTQIRLAVDPDLETTTGRYFYDCEEHEPARLARDDDTAEWLWNKSAQLVRL